MKTPEEWRLEFARRITWPGAHDRVFYDIVAEIQTEAADNAIDRVAKRIAEEIVTIWSRCEAEEARNAPEKADISAKVAMKLEAMEHIVRRMATKGSGT
jgi:uncharacterized protein YajQ (UPF0234 family)